MRILVTTKNLATIGAGNDEVVIGGVSYAMTDRDTQGKSTEVMFTAAEDVQNREIAGRLVRRMIAIAGQVGCLEADVLASDRYMPPGASIAIRHEGDVVGVMAWRHCGHATRIALTPPNVR